VHLGPFGASSNHAADIEAENHYHYALRNIYGVCGECTIFEFSHFLTKYWGWAIDVEASDKAAKLMPALPVSPKTQ